MFTHKHTHTHTVAAASARPLWFRSRCQERAEQWNTGSLVPGFGASGFLPTLLQNTLRLRGTALSAVGRPGRMENLEATRKTEGGKKKEAGKIYVLTHICGCERFLNASNTLTPKGRVLRENLNLKVKEKSAE